MAIYNYSSNPVPQPGKRFNFRIVIFILVISLFTFGLWFLIAHVMGNHSHTSLQRDAVFYDIGGKPAIVSGVKFFKAYSVSNKGTYGTDHDFVAAYDLQTGDKIWKQELDPQTNDKQPDGDVVVLGQTDNYLFALHKELFVLDKQTGKILKHQKDFDIADKIPTETAIANSSLSNYFFSDSLKTIFIKGNDGLYYTIDCRTLKTGETKIPNPDVIFERMSDHDTYDDFITAVYDDGTNCYTVLDDADTALLAHDSHGILGRARTESIRRQFYSTSSINLKDSWKKLNDGIYLFGGLLADPDKKFVQPADTVAKYQSYHSLFGRYETGSAHQAMKLPNGGFIIISKSTIQNDASVILTGTSADGKVLWRVSTPFTGLALIHRDGNNLYLFSNAKGHFDEDIQDICNINLNTGAMKTYQLKQEPSWF